MKRSNSKVYVCCIGANYTSQPYINKLIGVLNNMGVKATYLFWKRAPSDSVVVDGKAALQELTSTVSQSKISLLFGYIRWVIQLFLFAMKQGKKEDIFFVSRIDAGFPIFLASKFKRFRYVYLDRDAAFLSYSAPKLVLMVMKFIEKSVAINSVLHLIPGQSRNFTKASNVMVVPNSPSSRELDKAKTLRGSIAAEDPRCTIYINGWLKKSRGMSFILKAVRELSKNEFRILIAGEKGCPEVDVLCSLEHVTYLGVLNNAEALSLYYHSDVVLSFYDPTILINRLAEPNKWLDCVCTGTKFITNYGINTVQQYIDAKVCLQVNYGDAEDLVLLLKEIPLKKIEKDWITTNAELDFLSEPWDFKVQKILDPLFKS